MRLLLVVMVLGLAACSVSGEINIGSESVENATEDFIEETLGPQIGLGELDASCSKPTSDEVGSRFLCTAATEDGRTIEFQAEVEESGPYVETTNVVLAENIDAITATIVAEIESLSGVELADDALDCGDESLIVDASNQVVCDLTDPVGDVFPTTITFNGLDTNNTTFDFEVDTGG